MSKANITKMWVAGLIILVAGLVVGGVSLGLMFTNGGTWEPAPVGNGYNFVPAMNTYFWATVWIMILGFAIAVVGGILQLAAWIGALANTYQLADKAWFIALLAGGLLGLAFGLIGFAAMVAYLIAGPDGMPAGRPRLEAQPAPPQAAPPQAAAPQPAEVQPAPPQPLEAQPAEPQSMEPHPVAPQSAEHADKHSPA